MTEREVRLWMLEESAKDAWWLSVDEETGEEPVSLTQAVNYAADNPDQMVQLLHVSQAEEQNPPWILLDPAPVMTPEERADLSLPKSRLGFFLQLGLLLVVIAGVVYYFMPEPVKDKESQQRTLVDREEMIKRLSVVEDLGEAPEPSVDATLARSGRIFFITNHNNEAWPSIKIHLEDGYVCEWNERVEPGVTMQIPFRMFTKDGAPLPSGEVDLQRIVIEVPGLRKWEKNF